VTIIIICTEKNVRCVVTLAGKNDQLLLMHRPTIAHALSWAIIGRLPSNYWSITDQLLISSWAIMPHHVIPNYWSYIWPSTGRIIFWVWVLRNLNEWYRYWFIEDYLSRWNLLVVARKKKQNKLCYFVDMFHLYPVFECFQSDLRFF
jgi:hypothetical protein